MKEDTDSLTNDLFDTLLAALKLYDVVMILFTSGQQRDPSQHVLWASLMPSDPIPHSRAKIAN